MKKTEKDFLVTPLARARGLGSAKSGAEHWWFERLSAIALIPLCLWFAYSLVALIGQGASAEMLADWLATPANALLTVLFLIALFWHSAMGIQVVIEDYVHTHGTKALLIIFTKCLGFAAAAASIMAVVKLHFIGL
jgi:succinate dehydrogenase / fumarate reductase membrane anchor subunit